MPVGVSSGIHQDIPAGKHPEADDRIRAEIP